MTTNVDAYPEQSRYLYFDTGCELHPACLSCPLPVCQYDLTSEHGGPSLDAEVLARVSALVRQGLTYGEIAKEVGRSKRSIDRYIGAFRRVTGQQR